MVDMILKDRTSSHDGGFAVDSVLAELHGDVLGLVEDLRDYILFGQTEDYAPLTQEERALMCRSRAALTLQLTGLMAWVLHRKALRDGQMPAGLAANDELYDAMGQQGLGERIHQLPQRLSMLMWRSNGLYRRIENLTEGLGALPLRVGENAE
jgi:hypothetical protein